MAQLWPRAPEQCHRPGDVRSRHGRAAKNGIVIIRRVVARASICARRTDIGLYPIAPIDDHRAAAAK